MKDKRYKSGFYGVIASILLFLVYFVVVGSLQGYAHAIDRFVRFWYLMIPLLIGFGFQIGFFSYIRNSIKMGSGTVAASSSVSTVSMIACCLHHITDIIPFLGVSIIGVFLLEYQPAFLVVGIFSNIVGILLMFNIAKKGGMKFKSPLFKQCMRYDLKKITRIAIIFAVIIGIAAFVAPIIYQKLLAVQNLKDICATPPGYADQEWREHMSHHPEIYGKCLQKDSEK